MVVVLPLQAPQPLLNEEAEQVQRIAAIRAVRGKYRHALSSVDEFIARKQEEIALEESQAHELAP
jgi:hypothetical protein